VTTQVTKEKFLNKNKQMTKVTLLVLLVTCPAASMLLAVCYVIFFRFLETAFHINEDATIFIATVN
jgi:hypothetical protein